MFGVGGGGGRVRLEGWLGCVCFGWDGYQVGIRIGEREGESESVLVCLCARQGELCCYQ